VIILRQIGHQYSPDLNSRLTSWGSSFKMMALPPGCTVGYAARVEKLLIREKFVGAAKWDLAVESLF